MNETSTAQTLIKLSSLGIVSAPRHFEFSLYRASLQSVPSIGGVYAIWEHNRLVYIGKASNFRRRFYNHRTGEDGHFAHDACITFLPIPDEGLRVITEKWLIRRWTPRYNRHLYAAPRTRESLLDPPAIRYMPPHWSYNPLTQTLSNCRDECTCGCKPVELSLPASTDQLRIMEKYLWNLHESDALSLQDAIKQLTDRGVQ